MTEEEQKPVAYDAEGRPLYAAPVQPAPQVVHMARSTEPVKPEISESTKKRHEESAAKYPTLNLSDNEYVVMAIRRHPIGIIMPVTISVLFIAMIVSMAVNYPLMMASVGTYDMSTYASVLLICLLLVILFAIGGYIAVWVFMQNRFFLTNESVTQEIQTGIFQRKEQTVSLGNIEDASFSKRGLLQYLFDYGSVRLSTQGDETTYRFSYVANPKEHIAVLNNAIEAFKNGRPVGEW